jgi:hypothetical protein
MKLHTEFVTGAEIAVRRVGSVQVVATKGRRWVVASHLYTALGTVLDGDEIEWLCGPSGVEFMVLRVIGADGMVPWLLIAAAAVPTVVARKAVWHRSRAGVQALLDLLQEPSETPLPAPILH